MSQAEDTLEPSPADAAPSSPSPRFFRRVDWAACCTVLAVALGVYTFTLAPTVTLEDAGELIVAADYLGVPHPPGYPIWTLGAWLFQRLFGFMTFHGHPNPAWGVNFFSAFCGASACALLALLVSRGGADLLRRIPRFDAGLGARTESLFCWTGGVAAGLLLAFSPVLWSQSTIAEVYSLNTLFQVLVMVLLYRWMARPRSVVPLYAMAFVFGLGLTNHQTLLFLGIALGAAVLVCDRELFRDFVVAVGALLAIVITNGLLYRLAEAGRTELRPLLWVEGPAAPGFWISTVLFLAIPLAAIFWLPRGRTVGITILMGMLGLAFYAYMPLASEQNPPMNWGYARTWEGFVHAISRGQYEQVTPANIFSATFITQCFGYLTNLRQQFSLPVLLFGFLPFTLWELGRGERRFRMGGVALVLVGAAIALVVAEAMFVGNGDGAAPAVIVTAYKAVSGLLIAAAFVGMALLAIDGIRRLLDMFRQEGAYNAVISGALLALLVAVASYVLFMTFRHIAIAEDLALPNKIMAMSVALMIPLGLIGLAWLRAEPGTPIRLEADADSAAWLFTTWLGFLSLSFMFIIVLNPELDAQTVFIQRVQFIPSHAIFALWIGAGAILVLALAERLVRALPGARWALALTLLILLPGVPLWKNACDPYIVSAFGGAEQHGHHFGWYFGNWSLRGVEGIREDLEHELDAEEFRRAWASYPDPSYPPAMTPNAIFFGGTDPGRFVPTYMIYSALVRPDVFLITQNALADTTYLNVMRDLYGDRIFIPSIDSNNRAFEQYYRDIESGRTYAGADVVSSGDRVSVQGVGGVMQINAILLREMFLRDRLRHDFYVEESYAVDWMNDYLTPHGLIMKLNRAPTPLTDEMARKDRAFWDWLSERLMNDPKFIRDGNARRSFSKLRTSLAGLYASRDRPADAEYAFAQAIRFYPMSPEAGFRLADLYVTTHRFDQAREIVADMQRADPGNTRLGQFFQYIDKYSSAIRRRSELEEIKTRTSLTAKQAVELGSLYRNFQQKIEFAHLLNYALSPDAPAPGQNELRAWTLLCAQMQRVDLAERVMRRIVELEPENWESWLELGAILTVLDRPPEAVDA
ncbi:MAG: DUF2723 domain-containing protein, partial [Kiritimatiellae bacterium]|nr:DUF2723 domain-containing protein [Kiritimatiellia bacterium]